MSATVEYTDGRRNERPRAPLFSCRSDRAIEALKYWSRDLPPWNEVSATAYDSLGFPLIKLGVVTDGRWQKVGVIVCDSEERRAAALGAIEKEQRRRERDFNNG